VKVGDLVRQRPDVMRLGRDSHRNGIIVDANPLVKSMDSHIENKVELNEIVVMLPCGTMWHTNPRNWELVEDEIR